MSRGDQIGTFLSRFFAPEMRAWRGKSHLAKVFWGYGVLASSGLILLHVAAIESDQIALEQALVVASVCYSTWILVAIWRCAENAQFFWGTLARWLTIAWALNGAFVLVFLQLDLLVKYAGR